MFLGAIYLSIPRCMFSIIIYFPCLKKISQYNVLHLCHNQCIKYLNLKLNNIKNITLWNVCNTELYTYILILFTLLLNLSIKVLLILGLYITLN